MRGIEQHKLTSKERKVVIGVAIFMMLLLALWIFTIIWMLPNPSQGLV
jgi:type IV secretory pathway component VirB8